MDANTTLAGLLLNILDKHKIRYCMSPGKDEFNFRLKRGGATTLVSVVLCYDGRIDEIISEGLNSEEVGYPTLATLEEMIARNDRMQYTMTMRKIDKQ